MVLTRRTVAGALATMFVASCGLADVVSSPVRNDVRVRYAGTTLLVVGARVAPVIVVEVNGEPVTRSQVELLSRDTAIVALTAAGDTLLAKRLGRTWLIVRLRSSLLPEPGPADSTEVTVSVGAVRLDRTADTLWSLGDSTAPFVATAFDAQDAPIPGVSVVWRSLDSSVASMNPTTARATARGAGTAVVVAVVASDTARATVLVRQRLARFTFSPPTLFLDALTAVDTVVATAEDAGGSPIAGLGRTWESANANIATVDTGGRVTATANGVTYVRARNGTVADSVRVDVDQRATSVVIFPDPVAPIGALGDQRQLAASAVDARGRVMQDGSTPAWATLDPLVARVDSGGLVTGLFAGTARILASLDGAADTVAVEVRNDAAAISVTPDTVTIVNLGDSLRLTAAVRNSNGDPILDAVVQWQTPDSAEATVSGAGWVLARAVGTARIIGSVSGLADTARVRVLNGPVTVRIAPDSAILGSLGDSLLLPVEIRNKRDDSLPRSAVTWSSDAPLVARVTATGIVIAQDTGTTVVRATSPFDPGLSDSVLIRSPNSPASVVVDVACDTLTALGQAVGYAAVVRNARGSLIAAFPVVWTSSDGGVAGVSSAGVVTSLGFGTAAIVATAGAAADTLALVVRNPTLLYVDNGVVTAVRVGTRRRPYARIQDGVVAADANDTVLIRRGAQEYSEVVALTRRVTLLGDDSAFVLSNPRDPLLLPRLSHDSGAAGILAHTIAPVGIKNLTIQHTVDGPAIEAVHSDVRIATVFVNPPGTVGGRVGRGISVDSSLSGALVRDADVRNVRGYGIRLRDGAADTVDRVTVHTVDSVAGEEPGAGIRLVRETNARVHGSSVRGTQGPQILVDSSPGAVVVGNDLKGRQQLVMIQGGNGAVVDSNTFDTRPQGLNGEVFDGGVLFEWAALLLRNSRQHLVRNNTFRDTTGAAGSPMNALRVVDVANPTDPTVFGAQVLNNRILGGRSGVRSRRSKVLVQGTRIDSALTGVEAVETDHVTLVADTVLNPLQGACVKGTTSVAVRVSASRFDDCTVATPHAIDVAGDTLSVDASVFRRSRAAVSFTGVAFTARGDSASGAGFTSGTGTALAALQISATAVTIVSNAVTDHRFNAGIRVAGTTVRVDSNLVARNIRGVRTGTVAVATFTARHNDIADNDTAGAWYEITAGSPIDGQHNWWGDARGPRRDSVIAATGDSVVGKFAFDTVEAGPHYPGSGAAAALRTIRGEGQTQLPGRTLPKAFTVRVVDADGRPVTGTVVTFTVTGGGGTFGLLGPTTVDATSDASGLAEATLTLGLSPGTNTVAATAPGLNVVIFSATGT